MNLCHLGWRLKKSAARVLALGAAAALIVPAATPGPSTASTSASAEAASATPPISLWAPRRVVAFGFDGFVFGDLGLRVVAEDAPFELWSNRASYRQEIQTVWRSPSGDVPLPSGTMSSFSSGLSRFVKLTVTSGDRVRTIRRSACLGGAG